MVARYADGGVMGRHSHSPIVYTVERGQHTITDDAVRRIHITCLGRMMKLLKQRVQPPRAVEQHLQPKRTIQSLGFNQQYLWHGRAENQFNQRNRLQNQQWNNYVLYAAKYVISTMMVDGQVMKNQYQHAVKGV